MHRLSPSPFSLLVSIAGMAAVLGCGSRDEPGGAAGASTSPSGVGSAATTGSAPGAAGSSTASTTTASPSTTTTGIGASSGSGSTSTPSRATSSTAQSTATSTVAAGLARTPPMGWNNYNHFADNFTATTFEQAADAFVANGLKDVGYTYVNIDDSWDELTRDAEGNLVPSTAKFPDGITAVADYVHARGLKLGIYADRGTLTCSKYPGSFGHEAQDAALFASWGVDYVKVDNCYPNTGNTTATDRTQQGGFVFGTNPSARYQTAQLSDYTAWAKGLGAAGRPMLFSICAWWFYGWEPGLGNMFRTTHDIKATWASFLANLDGNGGDTVRYTDANYPPPGIGSQAGPGHWNDPDMLEVGNAGLTDVEQQAQFSLWAIMASPLILGNDLTNMSAATLSTIANSEVIAIDQDPSGVQGGPISASTTLEVWAKPLSGTNAYAVALFNRTAGAATISVSWTSLGLPGAAAVRDLWAKKDLGVAASSYSSVVPSHGVVLLRVTGQ